jgi:hypothetical protein
MADVELCALPLTEQKTFDEWGTAHLCGNRSFNFPGSPTRKGCPTQESEGWGGTDSVGRRWGEG